MQTLRVQVTGRVQGVGFRAWTRSAALRAGVGGWVQNRPDGSVLALLAGTDPATRQVLDAMRRGPPGAAVDAVTIEPAGAEGGPAEFEIR